MGLGAIFKTALLYTLIGMGTVFCVLMFISVCIWLLGLVCGPEKEKEKEEGAAAAAAVNMSVVALLHAVCMERFQNAWAGILLVQRRVVEKRQLLPLPSGAERSLQPTDLPPQDLFIVLGACLLLVKPAPGAA